MKKGILFIVIITTINNVLFASTAQLQTAARQAEQAIAAAAQPKPTPPAAPVQPVATPAPVTTPTATVTPAPAPLSNAWVLPAGNKRFDQVSFLMAHNAFNNIEEGVKLAAQQYWSVPNQLNHGVRGFMLDTYYDYPNTTFADLQVLLDTINDQKKKIDDIQRDIDSKNNKIKKLKKDIKKKPWEAVHKGAEITGLGIAIGSLEASKGVLKVSLAASEDVWNKNKRDKQILMCHGSCRYKDVILQRGGSGVVKSLQETLQDIFNWLKANPQEIVTLDLQNSVPNDTLKSFFLSRPEVALIFTPADFKRYSPTEFAAQRWPTLDWLRQNNKRLIIFNEDHSNSRPTNYDDPFFYLWEWCIESQYSTTDFGAACKQRTESQARASGPQRNLYIQNFFQAHGIFDDTKLGQIYGSINTYDNLKKLITTCQIQGVPAGKRPNFLALDFLNYGDGIRIINEINAGLL